MPDKLKTLSITVAQNIISSVPTSNLYLSIGKVEAWANDFVPPIAEDSVQAKIDLWDSMIFAKKITGNDMALVVPRYNWDANTVYTPYRHTANNLFSKPFYAVTSDYNVYKCLNNNQNANSTVQPTYTNPNQTNQTSDGYVWKYLYTLERSYRSRFMTDDWLPVKELTIDDNSVQWDVQVAARDGSIDVIYVTEPGSNYSNQANVEIEITGDGTNATGLVILDTTTNTVNSIVMSNPGSGYTFASATIIGGGGTGAAVVPVIAPLGGHGSDPVEELGASNILINMRIKGTEADKIVATNDFRQIGIIRNPIKFGTTTISSNTIITQTTKLSLIGATPAYINDEWVFQGPSLETASFKGKVVSYNSGNNFVLLANTHGTPVSAILRGSESAGAGFVSAVTSPELEPRTGHVLFIDNILAVSRNDDQTEDIKIVLTF
jgi:hypothetical protein